MLRRQATFIIPWTALVFQAIDLFLAVDKILDQRDIKNAEIHIIHERWTWLVAELTTIRRVSWDRRCLNPADESSFLNILQTSLSLGQELKATIQSLHEKIEAEKIKKNKSSPAEFLDAVKLVMGFDTPEPEWKRLEDRCSRLIDRAKEAIGSMNTISIHTIVEKTSETNDLLKSEVQYYWRHRRQASSRSEYRSRGSDSPSEPHSTGGGTEMLRMVRTYPSYIWDSAVVAVSGFDMPVNPTSSCHMGLFKSCSDGSGLSVIFWDPGTKFWHFQTRVNVPYSTMPIASTPCAVRLMAIRHQMSGVMALPWKDDEYGYERMQINATFPNRDAAQQLRGLVEGYKIQMSAQIMCNEHGRLQGIVDIIDLPADEYPAATWFTASHSEGGIRVLQLWEFEDGRQWHLGRSPLGIYILSQASKYSISPRNLCILKVKYATSIQTQQGVSIFKAFWLSTEVGQKVKSLRVRFRDKDDAARALALLSSCT